MERGLNCRFEIRPDLVDIGKLGKRPATVGAKVVHAWHPIGVHYRRLFLGVFSAVPHTRTPLEATSDLCRLSHPATALVAECSAMSDCGEFTNGLRAAKNSSRVI